MTRISDAGSNTTLIRYMMRTQQRMIDADYQVSSGQKSIDYAGISRTSQRLINVENERDLTSRYIDNNNLLQTDFSLTEAALTASENTMITFRDRLVSFKNEDNYSAEKVAEIQKWAFEALKEMEAYLNTSIGGRYIFSGGKSDTPPVNLGLTTLSDFQSKYDGAEMSYATTRDAHLSDLSVSKDASKDHALYASPDNWLTFRQDDDGDSATAGTSSIEATSDLFSGYKAGSRITVSGTTNNNGSYEVKSVSSDGTKIYIKTDMLTDETVLTSFAHEAAATAAVFTLPNGSTLTNATTGNIAFSAPSGLTATTGGSLSTINVGDTITISGTTSNDGGYVVESNDGTTLTVKRNTSATYTLADGTELGTAETGTVTFNRSANTLTATTANAFSGAAAGETITIANTSFNNDTFTIASVSSDGKTVTIDSTKLTDEGLNSGTSFYSYDGASKTVFDKTAGTIQAQTSAGAALAGLYSDVQAGDTITVAGTDFDFSSNTQVVFTNNGGAPNGTIQIQDSTGAAYTGVFADLSVGDTVTVANSPSNNTTFTVNYVSEDGSTITVDEAVTTETDTNGTNLTGGVTFTAATVLAFTAPSTVEIQPNGGGAAIAGALPSGLVAGDTFTIAGGPNAGTYTVATNNGTTITTTETTIATGTAAGDVTMHSDMNDASYTVSSVSTDGSTITVSETLKDQTDADGTTVSVATRNFSASTGTNLVFDATNDRIKSVMKKDGSAVTGVFSALRASQTLTVAGSQNNNGTFTVSSVAANGSYVDVSQDITVNETDGATNLDVYATDGTIATSSSYYQGDQKVLRQRIDEDRYLDLDITAADPAFEKAIRAMSIIAQGEWGTEGGLDQNKARVEAATYLMRDSIEAPADGTPPYGDELTSDIHLLQFNLGFNQSTLNEMIEMHTTARNALDKEAINLEQIDPLEAITNLLAEQRSLEASYNAMSRVFGMSLADFL